MQTRLSYLTNGKVKDNYLRLLSLHSQDGIQSLLEEEYRLEATFWESLQTWIIPKYCCRCLFYRAVCRAGTSSVLIVTSEFGEQFQLRPAIYIYTFPIFFACCLVIVIGTKSLMDLSMLKEHHSLTYRNPIVSVVFSTLLKSDMRYRLH